MFDRERRRFDLLRKYCEASALAIAGLGFLVLCGWTFHIEVLISVLPGLVKMKANTALCLLFSGASLWLRLPEEPGTPRRNIARFLALLVALIGAATLAEYLLGLNLRIDQFLFNESVGALATYSPGRMSPTAAMVFLAIGSALFLLDWKTRRGHQPAQLLSLWAAAVAMMTVIGYLYHARVLYRISLYTQIALHTSLALSLLSVAVFLARPRGSIAGDLTTDGMGSVMARRFLPAVFLIPIFLGWLRLQGQIAGFYETETGLALYATSNIMVFAVMVWWNARQMNQEHEKRSRAEVSIYELNTALEERVAERTKTLERQSRLLTEQAALLDLTQDSIFVRDMNDRITFWNRGAAQTYGWDAEKVLGRVAHELLHTEFPMPLDQIEAALLAHDLWEGELVHTRENQSRITVASRWALQRDLHGTPHAVLEINNDITERKQREAELQATKNAAEAANKAKGQFLANMSHEIRTPMNGVIGMTDLVLDTELETEQREHLEIVKSSAEALLTILNDILDFSKIEAHKLELEPIAFKFHAMIGDTAKMVALRAQQKSLELSVDIEPDVPYMLQGDPGRLRQILVNLLGNAIKFTDQGEVVLRVTRAPSTPQDDVVLHFSIRDTGIGIPQGSHESIFEAFTQADGSTTRTFGGTGLGLTISSQLVKLMGGRIWVESEPGRGSTFHFTARFDTVPTPPVVLAAGAVELRDLPVLVVDDEATNRRLLGRILTDWGMVPTFAANVSQALAALRKAEESGRAFPLVLTDFAMPDADGFSLAKTIKKDPTTKGAVIVMLTSAGEPGDAARCRDAGIGAYLLKPIDQSELRDAIQRAMGVHAAPTDRPVLVTRHLLREARRIGRILVVEDNKVNQLLIRRLLEKRGYTAVMANSGLEALAILDSEVSLEFDCVLMDVQMPGMGGFECTAIIREKEKASGSHLPIIAITAHSLSGDDARCLAAGMDGYLSKPFETDKFVDVIERHLRVPDVKLKTAG